MQTASCFTGGLKYIATTKSGRVYKSINIQPLEDMRLQQLPNRLSLQMDHEKQKLAHKHNTH